MRSMFESISGDIPRPTGWLFALSLAASCAGPPRSQAHAGFLQVAAPILNRVGRVCLGEAVELLRPRHVLFLATLVIGPSFFDTSWTRSVTGMVCFWNADGGEMNQKRSFPLWAATSVAALPTSSVVDVVDLDLDVVRLAPPSHTCCRATSRSPGRSGTTS